MSPCHTWTCCLKWSKNSLMLFLEEFLRSLGGKKLLLFVCFLASFIIFFYSFILELSFQSTFYPDPPFFPSVDILLGGGDLPWTVQSVNHLSLTGSEAVPSAAIRPRCLVLYGVTARLLFKSMSPTGSRPSLLPSDYTSVCLLWTGLFFFILEFEPVAHVKRSRSWPFL